MNANNLYSKVRLPTETSESIRLLTVQHDLSTGRIRCALHPTELTNAPPYLALSYSWQSPLTTTGHASETLPDDELLDIECNNQTIKVFYNLYHALVRLSRHPYTQRYFWIDCLCIDQSSIEERNHQIQFMYQIYSKAETVIIWLGPADDHYLNAFDLIEALCKLTNDQRLKINPHSLNDPKNKDIALSPMHEMSFWRSLAHLFRRNWFSRVWVIQEVLLAKSLVVLCGKRSLSWDKLNLVSGYLARSSWTSLFRDPEFLGYGVTPPHHGSAAKLRAAKKSLKEEQDSVLLNNLIRARQRFCKDPRDKVFGLYGLTPAYTSSTVQIPKANYKLSVEMAYIQAAVHVLEGSSDLHILAHAEGDKFRNLPHLPSWVPDWSVTEAVGLGITGYKRFWAAGDLSRDYTLLSPSRIIRLKAARIACITICGESKRDAEKSGVLQHWIDIFHSLADTYCNGDSKVEAFRRTLVARACPRKGVCPGPDPLGQSFDVWLHDKAQRAGGSPNWKTLADLCDVSRCLDLPRQRPSETTELEQRPDGGRSDAVVVCCAESRQPTDFGVAFSFRLRLRLFGTQEGFIGLGSESLDTGDSIWIVPGSRVPLILREKSGSRSTDDRVRYQLVGGPYLHGFMHGEALEGIPCDSGRKPLQFQMVEIE